MIASNDNYKNMFDSVAREFKARVELLRGSTLLQIFTHDGAIIDFTIDREGDNTKYFGFGVCQKLTLKLRDKERAITIEKGQHLQVSYGVENEYLYTHPVFIVDEVKRDENTNNLTVIGYDSIFRANTYYLKDLRLPTQYTLKYAAVACAQKLGMPVRFINIREELLNEMYGPATANFTGQETLRAFLDDLAEVFGCVYYLNNNWELTFRAYDRFAEPDIIIDKSKYFTLTAKEIKRVQELYSLTVLGDNHMVGTGIGGEVQYIRDNGFLTKRTGDDVVRILSYTLTNVWGMPLCEFDCKYRGDFRLEIGDQIQITTKDNATFTTIALCDTITYNGGLSGRVYRENGESDSVETEENPGTVSGVLSKTQAIVDKIENKITLEANRTDDLSNQVGRLVISTDSINATVAQTRENYEAYVDSMNGTINSITEQVSAAITSENLSIAVERTLSDGVSAVHTKTGFTFDSDGLSIHKSGTEMNTQITEDGMTVYRGDTALLTANHKGVDAKNLSASTYLTIGGNSRFEDFENGTRTACFWIGQ